jgi:NAD-dependent SIR2 family protein deacetylase
MSNIIFILGAGASKEAGGPLMSDFLSVADELRRSNKLDKKLVDQFDQIFTARGKLQSIFSKGDLDIYNIESLFALFEMMDLLGTDIAGMNANDLQSSLRTLIAKTLEKRILIPYVKINDKDYGLRPPKPYGDFVDLLLNLQKHGMTVGVITFNYDLALDFALFQRPGGEINYCLDPDKLNFSIPIMKLHGSLNWAKCSVCKRIKPFQLNEFFRLHYQFITESIDLDTSERLGHLTCCNGRVVSSEPVIVPPTWNKTRHYEEIASVWKAAAKHLSEAENIFVIGYSLPDSDQFFRYLYSLGTVSETVIKRFCVFNPDTSIEGRYRNLLGKTTERCFSFHSDTFKSALTKIGKMFNL